MDRQLAQEYSIRDLAETAGATVRTIHYYTAEGLLPPPSGTTRNATYGPAHLARLRLIAALREEGLALAAIRGRLAPLTDQQVLEVEDALDRHLAAGEPSPVSTLGLIEAALATQATEAWPASFAAPDMSAPAAQPRLPHEASWDQPPLAARMSMAPEQPAGTARDYLDRLL